MCVLLTLGSFLIMGFEFPHPDALYDEQERSSLEKGREAEQAHQYDQAEAHYLKIDNLLVREMTTNQLSSAWDSVNAGIIRAQEIVRQQPQLASARLELARQYYNKGLLHRQYLHTVSGQYPRDFVFEEQEYYFKEALQQAQKALQLDPNLPEADLLIGEMYLANARPDDALNTLKRLISKYPGYARGYYAIGKIYLDRKVYEKVERYFIRSIKLDPDFFDAYYLLGKFYFEQQWYDYAAYTFLEILRKKPNDAPSFDFLLTASHKLGDRYVEQEQFDKAIVLYREILELRSSYPVYQSLQRAKAKKADAELKAEEAAKEHARETEEAESQEPAGAETPQPEPAQGPQDILPEAEHFEPLD